MHATTSTAMAFQKRIFCAEIEVAANAARTGGGAGPY